MWDSSEVPTDKKNPYSYTEDVYVKKNSNFNRGLALGLALMKFKENKWKNLWDYKQLMYIYIDMWEYEKVINLWKIALFLMNRYKVEKIWVHAILSKIVQAYIYSWKIQEAEDIMEKYKNVMMFYERFLLEYRKWNHDYLVENYQEIKKDKRHYVLAELYLLGKSYAKEWDLDNAIRIYEELLEYGNIIGKEHTLISTYCWYLSSFALKELYLNRWNRIEFSLYADRFLVFKKRIDNEEVIENIDSNCDLHYNRDNMYFNIGRIDTL